MRFLLYVTLLIVILPIVFTRPFFGLCVYCVVSILQPKLLCWRGDLQDAMLVGVPLVIGAILFGVRRITYKAEHHPKTGQIVKLKETLGRNPLFEPSWQLGLFVLLLVYISVTRLIVPFPMSNNTYHYRSICKVLFVVVLLTGLTSDLRRMRVLYVVVALSAAFWAIKGGVKVMVMGPHQVYGKTYDNNLFALTSVMVLPMVFYYALSVKHARWRTILLVFTAMMSLGIIGSRSRAGFVAFAFVLVCMAWTSKYRLRAIFAVTLLGTVAMAMSGKEIRERVDSIISYRDAGLASSRLHTWAVARDLFLENPVIGVGFRNYKLAKDTRFGGQISAHNIFLQNLAELGLLGSPLWLIVIFGTMIGMYRFMRRSRRLPPDMRWAYYWSRGLCLGLAAFCIHGMFHNEEYLELMFMLVGLSVSLQAVTRRELHRRQMLAQIETVPKQRKKQKKPKEKPRRKPRQYAHPGRMFGVTAGSTVQSLA